MGLEPQINRKLNSINCPVRQTPMDLDVNCLYGSPLIDEIANLTAATIAFHIAKREKLEFRPPSVEFRTAANLKELVEFAAKDDCKPHIMIFALSVIQAANRFQISDEFNFAKIAATTYCQLHEVLASNSSREIPSPDKLLSMIGESCRKVTEGELRTLTAAQK